jgi:hypothetical protein
MNLVMVGFLYTCFSFKTPDCCLHLKSAEAKVVSAVPEGITCNTAAVTC